MMLVEFLLARYATAVPPEGLADGMGLRFFLADLESKRRIVEVHSGGHECPDDDPTAPAGWFEDGVAWCPTLRALALPYADHPDYREEWKP